MKQSLLMVCLGNICRSPLAEGIMRHLINEQGLGDEISVDSCGTSSYHIGETPHRGSVDIARRNGISLSGIRSRQLVRSDLDAFDYLIAMDESNYSDILCLDKRAQNHGGIVLLLDYAGEGAPRNVPDPYYEGGFGRVFELIYQGCEGFLRELLDDKKSG